MPHVVYNIVTIDVFYDLSSIIRLNSPKGNHRRGFTNSKENSLANQSSCWIFRFSWCFSFQFMKFVKKLRDGEYTIENNKACSLLSIFAFYNLFQLCKFLELSNWSWHFLFFNWRQSYKKISESKNLIMAFKSWILYLSTDLNKQILLTGVNTFTCSASWENLIN